MTLANIAMDWDVVAAQLARDYQRGNAPPEVIWIDSPTRPVKEEEKPKKTEALQKFIRETLHKAGVEIEPRMLRIDYHELLAAVGPEWLGEQSATIITGTDLFKDYVALAETVSEVAERLKEARG